MNRRPFMTDFHNMLVERGFQSMITNDTYVRSHPSRFRHYCKGPITVGLAAAQAGSDNALTQVRFAATIGNPQDGTGERWLAEKVVGRSDLEAALLKDGTNEFSTVIDAVTNTVLMPTCVSIEWMKPFINEWSHGRDST